MERAGAQHFVRTGELPARVSPFVVFLEGGDSAIMPPATIHPPMSLTATHMRGNMNMMVTDLNNVLRMSITEMLHTHITNEDPPRQLRDKLQRCYNLLLEKKFYEESVQSVVGEEEMEMYPRLLEVSYVPMVRISLIAVDMKEMLRSVRATMRMLQGQI